VTSVAAWSSGDQSSALLLTASKDCTARAWAARLVEGAVSIAAAAVLEGHSDALSAVVASPDGARCATGGADSQICLWRLEEAMAAASAAAASGAGAAAGKRRKKAAGDSDGGVGEAARLTPDATLAGHAGCVSSLCWPEAATLFSGGWDHTLRRWDVERGAVAAQHDDGGSKAVFALHARRGGEQLVAFAGAERTVRVWDARARDGGGAAAALAGHTGWVAAVRWCPWHDRQLISAGHDGALKLWDLRGGAAVHSLQPSAAGDDGEHPRLLAADFWLPGTSASDRFVGAGGADGHTHLLRAPAAQRGSSLA
jgi:ribosome biogenesis protein YTM1